MCMHPAPEWSGGLHILESAALNVAAVLEFPKYAERTETHAQHTMVVIADSKRRLDDLHRFPRWRQALERSSLSVPKKNLLGGSFDSR